MAIYKFVRMGWICRLLQGEPSWDPKALPMNKGHPILVKSCFER